MTSPDHDASLTPGKRPGIKEVAALAGVSWKTVTNVVHGRPNVRPETRRRVEEAIEKLGYQTNIAGRNLRLGRAGALALAVPEIESPYFARLAHEVIVAARARGLVALIDETAGRALDEYDIVSGGLARQTDGIIFSPLALDTRTVTLSTSGPPLVLVGEGARNPGLDHVGIDDVEAAAAATRHLIARGRTRIAFVGGDPADSDSTRGRRLTGYLKAAAEAGMEVEPAMLVSVASYRRRDGMTAMERLLRVVPDVDGIVCGNDLLAIGAMRYLREAGIAVPEQVAVIGWDAIEEGEYSRPSLSTIAPDVPAIAQAAVGRLVERIEGGCVEPRHISTPYRLIARQSTS